MIAVTKGTSSWRAAKELLPNEVEYVGDPAKHMVWDDAIGNIRPMTQEEISKLSPQRQAIGN